MAAIPTSVGTKRNSFRAVKNQKIACDFLIFYRSLKYYLPPQAAIRLMRQLHSFRKPCRASRPQKSQSDFCGLLALLGLGGKAAKSLSCYSNVSYGVNPLIISAL
jgi:hypothetical protein